MVTVVAGVCASLLSPSATEETAVEGCSSLSAESESEVVVVVAAAAAAAAAATALSWRLVRIVDVLANSDTADFR